MKFRFNTPGFNDTTEDAAPKVRHLFSDDFFAARCFNLWEAHLQWLHDDLGWTRAFDEVRLPAETFGGPTGHEVVDLLNDFVFQTGLVNAHVGLTSSDVVDNVRLMQVHGALDVIADRVQEFREFFFARLECNRTTVGFTHWQPAAPITWSHRVNAWLEPIRWAEVTRPCIFAKKFGGPVGDGASLKLLVESSEGVKDGTINPGDHPFPWATFGLAPPKAAHPLQSSDHIDEVNAVNWCCALTSQLHKIAQDLRFLASHQIVTLRRPPNHAGSSSMPHKMNPHLWEKVCSICRVVAGTQHEMWEVAAHNSLERTLDTSWQLKRLLERCLVSTALAFDTMFRADVTISDHDADFMRTMRPHISSDRDLMRQVLAGKSRWVAYNDALKLVNQPKQK